LIDIDHTKVTLRAALHAIFHDVKETPEEHALFLSARPIRQHL
jgi:hypothetical protein